MSVPALRLPAVSLSNPSKGRRGLARRPCGGSVDNSRRLCERYPEAELITNQGLTPISKLTLALRSFKVFDGLILSFVMACLSTHQDTQKTYGCQRPSNEKEAGRSKLVSRGFLSSHLVESDGTNPWGTQGRPG